MKSIFRSLSQAGRQPLRLFVLFTVLVSLTALLAQSEFIFTVKADNSYFSLGIGAPFTQDWTNPDLITVNDDWNGVLSINGYRGDDAAAGTGVDPQTIVTDAASTVLDVNINQTDPNTFATGGVAEFAIPDAVVALQGSGTGDFPNLDIRLNTSGCTAPNSVNVQYNLRDIDGSADNAVQPIALQYRVGATGNYTNIPEAFVADATTGPSLATMVTPVNVFLPAAALSQRRKCVRNPVPTKLRPRSVTVTCPG